MKYANIDEVQGDHGKRMNDFYRCYKCNRLFTRAQERTVFDLAGSSNEDTAAVCGCGSGKYSPTLPRWYEWAKPSVLSYTAKLVLARGLAPWCEKHLPELLSTIDWLVKRR